MRISLINPPPILGEKFIREGRCMQSVDSWAAIWPPLTLGILASVARLAHHEIDLFDGNVEPKMDNDSGVKRIAQFDPDVVVVNTAFPSIEGDSACASAIKRACPKAVIVGFGVYFTLLDDKAMRACPGFDVGICGEPEVTFGKLLDALDAKRGFGQMPGLMWREGQSVQVGPKRVVLDYLDNLPFAARDLFHNEKYTLPHNGKPFTLINVARGCPWQILAAGRFLNWMRTKNNRRNEKHTTVKPS